MTSKIFRAILTTAAVVLLCSFLVFFFVTYGYLDSSRQNYLLNSIGEIQTIITCTGLDEFVRNRFEINRVFQVVNGTVSAGRNGGTV